MKKKGYIRTLEAIIAILVIFIFVVTILPARTKVEQGRPSEIRLLHEAMLNEIKGNETLRSDVLSNNQVRVDSYVTDTIDLVGDYGFFVNIQDASGVITVPTGLPDNQNVYADSIVIASNLNVYSPKLVTLYLWDNLS